MVDSDFLLVKTSLNKPQLTIIFPISNRVNYVDESLKSILNQRGITAEILISDDASCDDSGSVAYETIKKYLSQNICEHKIKIRIGKRKLKRDHLHHMIENSECDIIMQAHDDDISHPDRAKITWDAFNMFEKMTMMLIKCEYINSDYKHDNSNDCLNYPIMVNEVALGDVVAPATLYAVGACQAWRNNSLNIYSKIKSANIPVAHDWIQAFRCALVGEVRIAESPLIKRRIHSDQWSQKMSENDGSEAEALAWNLQHLSCQTSCLNDLQYVYEKNIIGTEKFNIVKNVINDKKTLTLKFLMESYRKLNMLGGRPGWIFSE